MVSVGGVKAAVCKEAGGLLPAGSKLGEYWEGQVQSWGHLHGEGEGTAYPWLLCSGVGLEPCLLLGLMGRSIPVSCSAHLQMSLSFQLLS